MEASLRRKDPFGLSCQVTGSSPSCGVGRSSRDEGTNFSFVANEAHSIAVWRCIRTSLSYCSPVRFVFRSMASMRSTCETVVA